MVVLAILPVFLQEVPADLFVSAVTNEEMGQESVPTPATALVGDLLAHSVTNLLGYVDFKIFALVKFRQVKYLNFHLFAILSRRRIEHPPIQICLIQPLVF